MVPQSFFPFFDLQIVYFEYENHRSAKNIEQKLNLTMMKTMFLLSQRSNHWLNVYAHRIVLESVVYTKATYKQMVNSIDDTMSPRQRGTTDAKLPMAKIIFKLHGHIVNVFLLLHYILSKAIQWYKPSHSFRPSHSYNNLWHQISPENILLSLEESFSDSRCTLVVLKSYIYFFDFIWLMACRIRKITFELQFC